MSKREISFVNIIVKSHLYARNREIYLIHVVYNISIEIARYRLPQKSTLLIIIHNIMAVQMKLGNLKRTC